MKKLLTGMLALALLAGCSEEKTTNKETKPAEKKVEVSVEVTDEVFYKWNDDSIGGMEQITTYAVIKNTGNIPVDVSNASVTYLDGSGGVIGVTEANSIYQNIYPAVIAPDGVAYMAVNDDGGDTFKDLKDVEVKVNPSEMIVTVDELKTDKVSVKKNDSLSVTGFIKNETDNQADSVQLAVGLYDKDDKFLGAVLPGSDQSWALATDEDSSFDLSVPSFPTDQMDKVERANVISTSLILDK